MIEKVEKLIEELTKYKDVAYLWDRAWLENLEHWLLTLWLLEIDQYRIYKRLHHKIESKKMLDYSEERKNWDSDRATIISLNKKYKKEIEEKDIAEDLYKIISRYYEVFARYASALNSSFIADLAQAKRFETEQNLTTK